MLQLIKKNDLNSIKTKFICIYFLNITDIIFTLFLVNTGYFIEGNILMNHIVSNQYLSIVIKAGLTFILISFVYFRMKKATERQLFIGNILITFCLVLYILINLSHVILGTIYLFCIV